MLFKIHKSEKSDRIYICNDIEQINHLSLEAPILNFIKNQLQKASDGTIIPINLYNGRWYIVFSQFSAEAFIAKETLRKSGVQLQKQLNEAKTKQVTLINLTATEWAAYTLAEGIALSNYQFLKYFSNAETKTNSLSEIGFSPKTITVKDVAQLSCLYNAVAHARSLVNEPLSFLTAEQFSKSITELGREAGFKVTVLNKAKITQLGMGGLLAVNRGSILPPTFTIMEHKPAKPVNKQPIVLVGKGIVYDTGGLSLKPTANSMDRMKSDMGGGALVTGAMYAVAKLNLPLHIIALVPATDNRPGQNAYVPGDVIKMYSGTTVEVLNTDAEGRLILADALHYAKRYKPSLVLDFATLTGAASAAVGDVGIVTMGTANEEIKDRLKNSGYEQYERLVELPLWQEYGDMIKSDIADLKNIGGAYGGAITAGKFLEHFTDYPWMHFDIAGVTHQLAAKDYRTAGGTGYGLRMLLDFFINYGK